MFKRELKVNFKNFMIWTAILAGLFILIFAIYPSIMQNENSEMINEFMKMFPQEVLKAFNMDVANLDTVFGWLKSEGYIFILLITGIYAAMLGSNIVLKEENDKTIEYLNSLPVTRKTIIGTKIACGLLYILLINIVLTIVNYIGLSISGDFDKTIFIYFSISPILSSIVIFALSLFSSTFFHKTKKMMGISLGIVFISYFLQVISKMGDKVEFLKYFSIFTLADIRDIITNNTMNIWVVFISIGLTVILLSASIIRYERKELV